MNDIERFLQEDLGADGDITSDALFTSEQGHAHILAKEQCVIAGMEEAEMVFSKTGATIKKNVNDGDAIAPSTVIAEVDGSLCSILKGERLALNFLGRMSGIATETRELVERCSMHNPKVSIAATRKTTPGFRIYEKKAVMLGGGEPHRYGLYDAIMIKDNHIRGVGALKKAIEKVQSYLPTTPIEVEVETEEEALTAAQMHVAVIMLDNFSPEKGEKVAKNIKK
ncbi:MAG: carboxylating nicotinate-nucleotide diphosphorylase, partial [Candidatus Thermoplasmatota archaeon]|nr:carboxylating nicotinate-nucleotide diphosphorylase [Candidatus Thermoplasmatota archaeon]